MALYIPNVYTKKVLNFTETKSKQEKMPLTKDFSSKMTYEQMDLFTIAMNFQITEVDRNWGRLWTT